MSLILWLFAGVTWGGIENCLCGLSGVERPLDLIGPRGKALFEIACCEGIRCCGVGKAASFMSRVIGLPVKQKGDVLTQYRQANQLIRCTAVSVSKLTTGIGVFRRNLVVTRH